MRRIFLACIFLAYHLHAGHCLKCWECLSSTTWDDCKLLKSKQCTLPEDRCGKLYTKQGNVETYKRDCFTNDYCTNKPFSSSVEKFTMHCCSKDTCNVATKPYAAFLIIASSFIVCLFILSFY